MVDAQELQNKTGIEVFQNQTPEDFASKYSSKTPLPRDFSDEIGHFTTNEYDYPNLLKEIRVRGGIHLAVIGGVDPVLGQLAISNPDLTIMMDINRNAMTTFINGRIKPILETANGDDYWLMVSDYFMKVIRRKDPTNWALPTGQDVKMGGWSSPEYFSKVKNALLKGKIKWTSGDITSDGIELAFQVSKKTGKKIKLIYVSNIFSYSINNRQAFVEKLMSGVQNGYIDKDAQIIDSGLGKEGIETKVFDLSTYATI